MNTTTATNVIRPVVLQPQELVDPRDTLDNRELIAASRNAFPVVARKNGKSDSMALAAGGAVAVLLGGATFLGLSSGRDAQTAVPPPAVAAPPPASALPPAMPMPAAQPAPAPGPIITAQPLPPTVTSTQPVSLADLQGRRWQSPAMVFDGSAPIAGPAGSAVTPATPAAGGGEAAGVGDNETFAARVGGSGASGDRPAVAVAMTDPASTVTQGTLIPAVLETAIDTDLPGYVRAVVSRDIRSFDGSRVLVPRSSRLIGQYKSGLAAGQTRAYVIWTRIIRPDGASVALASPGVDFQGRSGLAGETDNHFMKRFGSAMLLSVVGGLSALGTGGASVILGGGGQSAASVAAGRDGAIPPTIRIRQGEPIRIFTARDLDFSKVSAG